jgi:hypothetical protein
VPDIEFHATIQYFRPVLIRTFRVTRPDIEETKFVRTFRVTRPDIETTMLTRTINIGPA